MWTLGSWCVLYYLEGVLSRFAPSVTVLFSPSTCGVNVDHNEQLVYVRRDLVQVNVDPLVVAVTVASLVVALVVDGAAVYLIGEVDAGDELTLGVDAQNGSVQVQAVTSCPAEADVKVIARAEEVRGNFDRVSLLHVEALAIGGQSPLLEKSRVNELIRHGLLW